MTDLPPPPRAVFGWSGFAVGAAALILTLVIVWAGPFAPQPPAGVTLGEMAADIMRSAARSVAGQPQPAPEPLPRTLDDYLRTGVAVLAGLAVVLGMAGLVRNERRAAAASGIALGLLAVGVQLFAMAVMAIVGALVVAALVYALKDALGDLFA
jgi:hypothetical protein